MFAVPNSLMGFFLQLLGLVSTFAVCAAIGFSVFRSIRLVMGERELQRRLSAQVRLDQLTKTLEGLSSNDPAGYLKAMVMLQKQLALMRNDGRRRELWDALQQATDRGRRAYAAKLLREAAVQKSGSQRDHETVSL